MRMVDVKCEGEANADGSCKLIISVDNLTMAEAQAIGDAAKDPFRAIVHNVLGKGGTVPLESRNMQEPTQ